MKNPVDEYFANDLENIEIAPRKDLWAEKIAPRVAGKEEKKPVWMWRAAAVVVILLSGWFVVRLLQPNHDQVQALEIRTPVVLEGILVKPTILSKTLLEPIDDAVVELKSERQTAAVGQKEQPTEEPRLEWPEDYTALAQVEPQDIEEETEAQKPKIKMVLKLNSTEHAMASADVPKQHHKTFGNYAREQWENVKQGDKIESPEKLINWPKIKVEGNPLRGMFAAKGE